MERTAHVDTFARDHLPPEAEWPVLDWSGAPELAYPPRLNCATELLERAVERWPDRPAIHFAGSVLTYSELLARTNRVARALVEDFGVVPGARVLLRGPNNPTTLIAYFAVMRAGAIAVATMPMLRARELRYIVDKAQCKLSITDDRFADEIVAAADGLSDHRVVRFDELLARAERKRDDLDGVDTAADDVALIAFTSGTTGNAKATMHFHRDLLAVSDLFPTYALGLSSDDVCFGSPPLAFTYGLGGLALFPFRFGASTLLIEKVTPDALMEAMSLGSVLFTAPTMYRLLAEQAKQRGRGKLRKCVSGGETLPKVISDAFHDATGIRIIDGIGSTEMLHIFITAADDDIRVGATGKPLHGYQACVVDEHGKPVPAGTVGRLYVRGPTGCRYLDDLEAQRRYVRDGWNFTGDAYKVDEDGYFCFVARADDMIISAGYNISGPEVEAVLLEHPLVKECAVVASPDVERGSIVKAFVVLRDAGAAGDASVRALQDHVKKTIAPYKYPRAVEFVEALPKTQSGKVQRFRLRQAEAEKRRGG